MTPDFMLAGVASLIFVAVIIAALTTRGDSKVSERHGAALGGLDKPGPTKSKRHAD